MTSRDSGAILHLIGNATLRVLVGHSEQNIVPEQPQDLARPRRIVLIDDHKVVREAFAQLLDHEPDFEVAGQSGESRGGFAVIQRLKPDLAIIDISLEGCDGLELMKNVRAWDQSQRMLALSMHDESIFAERALRAGASGYVMKRADAETVISAARAVLAGDIYLSASVKGRFLSGIGRQPESTGIESLSDRELEVFTLIGQGLNSAKAANSLGISPKTVETHRARIKRKLNLENGAELMRAAVSWVESSSRSDRASPETDAVSRSADE